MSSKKPKELAYIHDMARDWKLRAKGVQNNIREVAEKFGGTNVSRETGLACQINPSRIQRFREYGTADAHRLLNEMEEIESLLSRVEREVRRAGRRLVGEGAGISGSLVSKVKDLRMEIGTARGKLENTSRSRKAIGAKVEEVYNDHFGLVYNQVRSWAEEIFGEAYPADHDKSSATSYATEVSWRLETLHRYLQGQHEELKGDADDISMHISETLSKLQGLYAKVADLQEMLTGTRDTSEGSCLWHLKKVSEKVGEVREALSADSENEPVEV